MRRAGSPRCSTPKLGADLAEDAANTEAAIAFAEKGPQAMEDLQVSQRAEGFDSYAAFKKIDLEKRFGPAGDGYEYHHIVEQGPNASTLSAQDLVRSRFELDGKHYPHTSAHA